MKILVINGANMNMLGRREPDIYGKEDYAALCARIYEHAQNRGLAVECFQSNHEGAIIDAIQEADSSGYGIVTPSLDELTLEEPEIVKQGSRYGVRLKAAAPSYHIIKANIETEVSPIVGSEKQSEELVRFLLTGFEEDPKKIWESNIFGKSLSELVNEGLHTKLNKMPTEARQKMQSTLERIINEGSSGLICIIL
mgnify:CR=1 FL=1